MKNLIVLNDMGGSVMNVSYDITCTLRMGASVQSQLSLPLSQASLDRR